jgi:peptidoglycan/LPS O-acetylase OafA/YrhL
MLLVGGCALLFFVLMAYTVLKLYDESVRAWLKRKPITAKTQVSRRHFFLTNH